MIRSDATMQETMSEHNELQRERQYTEPEPYYGTPPGEASVTQETRSFSWKEVRQLMTLGSSTLKEKIEALQKDHPTARFDEEDTVPECIFPRNSTIRIEKLTGVSSPLSGITGYAVTGELLGDLGKGRRIHIDGLSTAALRAVGYCDGQMFVETEDALYAVELVEASLAQKEELAVENAQKEALAAEQAKRLAEEQGTLDARAFDATSVRSMLQEGEAKEKEGWFKRLKNTTKKHWERMRARTESEPHSDFVEQLETQNRSLPRWRRAALGLGALGLAGGGVVGYYLWSGGGPTPRTEAAHEETDETGTHTEQSGIVLPNDVRLAEPTPKSELVAERQAPAVEPPTNPQEIISPTPPTAPEISPAPVESGHAPQSKEEAPAATPAVESIPTPPTPPPSLFHEAYTVREGDRTLSHILDAQFKTTLPQYATLTPGQQKLIVGEAVGYIRNHLTQNKRFKVIPGSGNPDTIRVGQKLNLQELGGGFSTYLDYRIERLTHN